jgi:hypothetical protein
MTLLMEYYTGHFVWNGIIVQEWVIIFLSGDHVNLKSHYLSVRRIELQIHPACRCATLIEIWRAAQIVVVTLLLVLPLAAATVPSVCLCGGHYWPVTYTGSLFGSGPRYAAILDINGLVLTTAFHNTRWGTVMTHFTSSWRTWCSTQQPRCQPPAEL